MAKKSKRTATIHGVDTTRASRGGHTFHERWAARRAMQLVVPQDRLNAIAVEGISTSETAQPGAAAADVADLVLYFGSGETFAESDAVQTAQFKYKTTPGAVTASYLRKTIEKFADSIIGYEKHFSAADIDKKVAFAFVTNAEFSSELWEAIKALKSGCPPTPIESLQQYDYLADLCKNKKVDVQRLFSRCEFRASEDALPALNSELRRTIFDWSAGADQRAKARMFGLTELLLEKAGPRGQKNNVIKREDVLNALGCEPEDLFPANTRFIDVGEIVPRKQLDDVRSLIAASAIPVFIHADGGVGKTVFIESLAADMSSAYEVVVFDCFGGGAYRSTDQVRHLPAVGFVQLTNELASRGLCDPLLPGDDETVLLIKAMRRRLTQAVATLRTQSKKEGLLIVIDAADNAQLEASNRKDRAFPNLLLESLSDDKIEGVKLVLTARTHRMPEVIARSIVARFELLPFTADEAKAFLSSRREENSGTEFVTALSRSGGNARVLAYLIKTWDVNVAGNATKTEIKVEHIIADQCDKIFSDLHVAGWLDSDIREFFAAISLLPPPIPLEELANALGWSIPQVRSAASDLAPMLEIVPHGAIFRDEPTETYVHDTFSREIRSQQAIAQRLQDAQVSSAYAGEALPNFLVAIEDSDRAYALTNSTQFPSLIRSDFGRRRLTLARLNAAFKLAVKDGNLDRVLLIAMRLAQVAAANSRGDAFIRRSPSLAVTLGDPDAYRRLFNDRSGWRGARDARLTVAHAFSNEMEEAEVHWQRAIGWINWSLSQPSDDGALPRRQSGPEVKDYAAVLFFSILQRDYSAADRNLSRWNRRFSLSVAREAVKFVRQYECVTGTRVLDALVKFASTKKSKSFALKIVLLMSETPITSQQRKSIARALKEMRAKPEKSKRYREGVDGDIIYAAFASLVHDGQTSAAQILRAETQVRLAAYDYGERHGHSKAWIPVLQACVIAWSKRRAVAIHDLLPEGVKITRAAKALKTQSELTTFLAELPAIRRKAQVKRKSQKGAEKQFDGRERHDIARGIETILQVIEPLQTSMLARGNNKNLKDYLNQLQSLLPKGVTRINEEPHHVLCRAIGLGFAKLLLRHTPDVSEVSAKQLVEIISDQRFIPSDRTNILALFATRPLVHEVAGSFAQAIAEGIRKNDYIEQRGDDYASLAESLVEMSIFEAREYYRSGLAELDKLGSNDYDLIYAILNYAAAQPGGLIRPELGHRLMNLCQTICAYDSSKFGWKLFAKASAKSVGTTAVTKVVRWEDQEVSDFSYGLPQLVCFLAAEKRLSPLRAAGLLAVCKDHGWHEWTVGEGLEALLELTTDIDKQRSIFATAFERLKLEHSNGGWPLVWESLLALSTRFPKMASDANVASLRGLLADAEKKRDDYNSRSYSAEPAASIGTRPSEINPVSFLAPLVAKCDCDSAASIDEALRAIESQPSLPYFSKNQFFEGLRVACPYNKRLGYLLALAEAAEISVASAIDQIKDCVSAWASSSTHIVAECKNIVEHLFKHKGSDLFEIEYGNVARELIRLTELCGDAKFVLRQVLNTISTERVELDGEDWLQLATVLCKETSPSAAREALETLLSGPAAGLADDVGEGPYQQTFHIEDECALVSGLIWHMLGDNDAYTRWKTARALSAFAELGLIDELCGLLDRFDQREVPALKSADRNLSFQNSQQWLLMGLARAALIHGQKLAPIKSRLLGLAARADLHVLHKQHILRCLVNIGNTDAELASLRVEISSDPKGVAIVSGYPVHVKAASGFSFDYEFMKSEIASLSRLFWISDGESTDAIAAEIKRLWPQATDINFFPGHDRYRRDRSDRYELYREHVQKHAILSAATTLRKSQAIARHTYDEATASPFKEWLNDYDITFEDGSWLADHKDDVPEVAKANLLGPREGNKESIVEAAKLFERLELVGLAPDAMLPIAGHWRSPDGVNVRIVSALGSPRGIVGRCAAFSKRTDHDLWLPMFSYGGLDDPHRQKRPFDSFIWEEENHSLGIDTGEKIATRGAAERPRLGVELTAKLGLIPDADGREWRTVSGELGLRSQVWGEWVPDPDNHRHHRSESGEILWAAPEWLDRALPRIGRHLVYLVTLQKYKGSRSYSNDSGAKAVYVGTRPAGKSLRFWFAKKSSETIY